MVDFLWQGDHDVLLNPDVDEDSMHPPADISKSVIGMDRMK